MITVDVNRTGLLGTTGLLVMLAAPLALAQPADWGARISPGLELTSHLNDRLDIRFGVNSDDRPLAGEDTLEWEASADTPVLSAMVDWSLHDGGLRMTGGALYGEDLFDESTIPTPEFSADDMQTYVGVGYDNDFGTNGRLGLSLDMGLTFDSVSGSSVGQDVDNTVEDAELGSRFQSFRYTPSFSAGVEYRF